MIAPFIVITVSSDLDGVTWFSGRIAGLDLGRSGNQGMFKVNGSYHLKIRNPNPTRPSLLQCDQSNLRFRISDLR